MARIKIKDLNVDLKKLSKKDPTILKKIRGGFMVMPPVMLTSGIKRGGYSDPEDSSGTGSGGGDATPSAGADSMYCDTTRKGGCQPGADSMYCNTTTECAIYY